MERSKIILHIKKMLSYFARILEWAMGILLSFIIILSFLQVLSRYVFHFSWPWAEEIARLLLVWATFIGMCTAIRRQSHMKVDFIFSKLPPKGKLVTTFLIDTLLIFIAVIMIVAGSKYCLKIAYDCETSLRYPRSFFFWPVPFSGIVMIIFLLESMSRVIKELYSGGKR